MDAHYFFRNDHGTFTKVIKEGLGNSTGWWSSIEKGDFDNDGDIDFVAGNLGLNYKYKTSENTPFDVYYDDFDRNGKFDVVLGYYNEDKHYPLRGFSCSSQQIPGLKTKFKEYDVFASLELGQLYGERNLQKALRFEAKTFASSYVENLGAGRFKISPLPNKAQFSNINDIIVQDFNKDGNLDAIVVGNLFVSEIETPRNDAGTGLLMLGDGNGNFSPITSMESGFFARRDAKNMQTIEVGAKEVILIANNNDYIQAIECLKPNK